MSTAKKKAPASKASSKKASAKKATAKAGAKKSASTKTTAKKAASKKTAPKKPAAKTRKSTSKRELIAPRGDKRYIRRDAQGRIKESDDVSRSLSADRRRKAKTKAKKGQGDRGD
jgi:hypothetical protein